MTTGDSEWASRMKQALYAINTTNLDNAPRIANMESLEITGVLSDSYLIEDMATGVASFCVVLVTSDRQIKVLTMSREVAEAVGSAFNIRRIMESYVYDHPSNGADKA